MAGISTASALRKAANELRDFVTTVHDTLQEMDTRFVYNPSPDDPWSDRGLSEVAFGTKYMLWPPIVSLDAALRGLELKIRGETLDPHQVGTWSRSLAHHVEFPPQHRWIGPRILRLAQSLHHRHNFNVRPTVDNSGRQVVAIPQELVHFVIRAADALDELAEELSPRRERKGKPLDSAVLVRKRRPKKADTISYTQEELDKAIRKYFVENSEALAACLKEVGQPGAVRLATHLFGRNAVTRVLRCSSQPMVGKSQEWRSKAIQLELPIKEVGRKLSPSHAMHGIVESTVVSDAHERDLRTKLAAMGSAGQVLLAELDDGTRSLNNVAEILMTMGVIKSEPAAL